jgi:S1-C subfamily serine protease
MAAYDARGNVTEVAYFDEAGRLTRHTGGYARMAKKYDAEGDLLNITYYGLDGDPIAMRLMAEEIDPGGQAAAIGLEPGDTILSYDGQGGLNQATFIRAVQAPGEGTRALRILRRGAVLTFQVQPGGLGIHLVDRPVQGEKMPSP